MSFLCGGPSAATALTFSCLSIGQGMGAALCFVWPAGQLAVKTIVPGRLWSLHIARQTLPLHWPLGSGACLRGLLASLLAHSMHYRTGSYQAQDIYDEVMLTDMSSNSCRQGTHTNKKFEQIGELSVTRLYCLYILVTFCNKTTELDSMKPNNKVIIKQEKKAEMTNIYYVL